jgi:S1-C subfamily serine protease
VPPATPATLKVIRNHRPTVAGFSNTAVEPKATGAREAAQAAEATDAPGAPGAADAVDPAGVTNAVATTAPSDVRPVKAVMPEVSAQPVAAAAAGPHRAADRLGLVMHALNAEEKRSTGLPLGLMVDASTGPAASAGVRPGDVVLSLNDTLVESQEEAAALEAKATKSMSLLIQRNSARSFVAVKVK